MASIENNILTDIQAKGRGSIVFPSDFTSCGEVKAVAKRWNAIHHHRELFTSMSGVDYTPDIRLTSESL